MEEEWNDALSCIAEQLGKVEESTLEKKSPLPSNSKEGGVEHSNNVPVIKPKRLPPSKPLTTTNSNPIEVPKLVDFKELENDLVALVDLWPGGKEENVQLTVNNNNDDKTNVADFKEDKHTIHTKKNVTKLEPELVKATNVLEDIVNQLGQEYVEQVEKDDDTNTEIELPPPPFAMLPPPEPPSTPTTTNDTIDTNSLPEDKKEQKEEDLVLTNPSIQKIPVPIVPPKPLSARSTTTTDSTSTKLSSPPIPSKPIITKEQEKEPIKLEEKDLNLSQKQHNEGNTDIIVNVIARGEGGKVREEIGSDGGGELGEKVGGEEIGEREIVDNSTQEHDKNKLENIKDNLKQREHRLQQRIKEVKRREAEIAKKEARVDRLLSHVNEWQSLLETEDSPNAQTVSALVSWQSELYEWETSLSALEKELNEREEEMTKRFTAIYDPSSSSINKDEGGVGGVGGGFVAVSHKSKGGKEALKEKMLENYKLVVHSTLEDMLKKEESYVEDLITLVGKYLKPLETMPSLSKKEQSVLFSDIESILMMSQAFLTDLRTASVQWESTEHLSHVFQVLSSTLKVYTRYVQNVNKAKTLVDTLTDSNPQFAMHLEKTMVSLGGKSLECMLELPITHFPTYAEMTLTLSNQLPPTHKDYKPMQQASSKVTQVVDQMKERIRTADLKDRFETLSKQQNQQSNGKTSPRGIALHHEAAAHKRGRIIVTIQQGRNLAGRELGASTDPYVFLYIPSMGEACSRTLFKTHHPVWNQEFVFTAPLRSCLYVLCFDGKNTDLIGAFIVPISEIKAIHNEKKEVWFPLKTPNESFTDVIIHAAAFGNSGSSGASRRTSSFRTTPRGGFKHDELPVLSERRKEHLEKVGHLGELSFSFHYMEDTVVVSSGASSTLAGLGIGGDNKKKSDSPSGVRGRSSTFASFGKKKEQRKGPSDTSKSRRLSIRQFLQKPQVEEEEEGGEVGGEGEVYIPEDISIDSVPNVTSPRKKKKQVVEEDLEPAVQAIAKRKYRNKKTGLEFGKGDLVLVSKQRGKKEIYGTVDGTLSAWFPRKYVKM